MAGVHGKKQKLARCSMHAAMRRMRLAAAALKDALARATPCSLHHALLRARTWKSHTIRMSSPRCPFGYSKSGSGWSDLSSATAAHIGWPPPPPVLWRCPTAQLMVVVAWSGYWLCLCCGATDGRQMVVSAQCTSCSGCCARVLRHLAVSRVCPSCLCLPRSKVLYWFS